MNRCRLCGSHAVNDHLHGREAGVDLDLCDVCYWRTRYEAIRVVADGMKRCLKDHRFLGRAPEILAAYSRVVGRADQT